MSAIDCPREHDVVAAVRSGRWGAGQGDAELLSHAADCPICADVALAAACVNGERNRAWRDAQLPPAGQMWWRITIRARADAARTAGRPITLVQGLGGACAAGLCAALLGWVWPPVGRWLTRLLVSASQQGTQEMYLLASSTLQQTLWTFWPVLAAVGLCVLVMPIALYLVLSDE